MAKGRRRVPVGKLKRKCTEIGKASNGRSFTLEAFWAVSSLSSCLDGAVLVNGVYGQAANRLRETEDLLIMKTCMSASIAYRYLPLIFHNRSKSENQMSN